MSNKLLSIFVASTIACSAMSAHDDTSRVTALRVDRSTDRLLINMTIDANGLGNKTNRESWLTPILTDTADDGSINRLRLPSVMVGGRNRYYQAIRRNIKVPLYRGGLIDYAANIEWQSWMESASLYMERVECGCCGTDSIRTTWPLTHLDFVPRRFSMPLQYVEPAAEEIKVRHIKGSAFIDFPVNRTEIYPEYRSNPIELAVIRSTIDSVRIDPDITVQSITFKGYASPDGPYKNNARLAIGRTEALKAYVQGLYHFNPEIITTESVPEDWAGLRLFMETSGLDDQKAILALIDSDISPDDKEMRLRSEFPSQYTFLLKEVYPALRHTDYTIVYNIRSYSDPKEILRLVYSRPQNLSLNEFFLAARSVPVGSAEYNYIFETAARMYPTDQIANLNAANAAMSQGSLENAAAYLAKAGESPDAIYARGQFAALSGNYDEARTLFTQAARLKVASAPEALRQLDEIIEHNTRIAETSIDLNN